jgi:hypothetical protein
VYIDFGDPAADVGPFPYLAGTENKKQGHWIVEKHSKRRVPGGHPSAGSKDMEYPYTITVKKTGTDTTTHTLDPGVMVLDDPPHGGND